MRHPSLRYTIRISVTAAQRQFLPLSKKLERFTSHNRLDARLFSTFCSAVSFHLYLPPFITPPALLSPTTMPPSTAAFSAPLPSPSSQPSQYFPLQTHNRHRTSLTQTKEPQVPIPRSQPDAGAGTSTKPEGKDFCLIAEAAKRAQMACLMRDLGEVAL